MQRFVQIVLCLSVSLVSACSSESQNSNEAGASSSHVWETQTRALEKAKNVNNLVLDAAGARRKAIEEQAQ